MRRAATVVFVRVFCAGILCYMALTYVWLYEVDPNQLQQSNTFFYTQPCTGHLKCHDSTKPLCKFDGVSHDYATGTWEKLLTPPPYTTANGSNSWLQQNAYAYQDECNSRKFNCRTPEPNSCRQKSMDIVSYQWLPRSCSLRPFDAKVLDKSLGGKTVLFIGDSLMQQMYNSWRFLTRPVWRSSKEILRTIDESYTTTGGNKYLMQWAPYMINTTSLSVVGMQWTRIIATEKIDYVVFNVGQEWHKFDHGFVLYRDMVDEVLEYLKQHFQGKIIFRSTTLGHYECDGAQIHSGKEPRLGYDIDGDHWRKLAAADLVWHEVAYELGLQHRFMLLNVSNSNSRPDGHPEKMFRQGRQAMDCLNWCLPGVPGKRNRKRSINS